MGDNLATRRSFVKETIDVKAKVGPRPEVGLVPTLHALAVLALWESLGFR